MLIGGGAISIFKWPDNIECLAEKKTNKSVFFAKPYK